MHDGADSCSIMHLSSVLFIYYQISRMPEVRSRYLYAWYMYVATVQYCVMTDSAVCVSYDRGNASSEGRIDPPGLGYIRYVCAVAVSYEGLARNDGGAC